MKRFRPTVVLFAVATITPFPQPARADATQNALARDLLGELVAIDTTPTHGCTRAAEAMAARLRANGFSVEDVLLVGDRPDRQNLFVRLRGSGQAKPILFIAHLDTVEAPRDGWNSNPFQLTERDGALFGRGVNDIKNGVASLVATFIRLRAENYVPSRDVLLALTADEETGSANGVSWLITSRPDLVDVAYCVNLDGGGGLIENGRRARLTVQTSEKTYLSFRAEATSAGGHSSLPVSDNAIYRLAAALTRLATYDFPYRFNETTRGYFGRLATLNSGALADDMRVIAQQPPDLAAARRVAAASPLYNAMLHTTAVATRVEAGHADNALPQFARAIINCRVFPGDSADFVERSLTAALSDPQVKLTRLGAGRDSPVSSLLPEVWNAVEAVAHELWPDVPVLPTMDPWATDSVRLRRAGIPTFALSGTFGDVAIDNTHGANERIGIESFNESTEFLYRLMKRLAAPVAKANR